MKTKLFQMACGLLLVAVMMGCGKKHAKDIQIGDLETVCEVVDAMEIVIDDIATLVGDAKTESDLSEEQKMELKALNAKGEEIGNAGKKLGKREEMQACSSYERFKEKGMKLEEFLE